MNDFVELYRMFASSKRRTSRRAGSEEVCLGPRLRFGCFASALSYRSRSACTDVMVNRGSGKPSGAPCCDLARCFANWLASSVIGASPVALLWVLLMSPRIGEGLTGWQRVILAHLAFPIAVLVAGKGRRLVAFFAGTMSFAAIYLYRIQMLMDVPPEVHCSFSVFALLLVPTLLLFLYTSGVIVLMGLVMWDIFREPFGQR